MIGEDDENDTGKSDFPDFMEKKGYSKHPVYRDGTLKFFPPVYVQRYEAVALLLKDPAWKNKMRKVVDFGCAELGFFMYLKNTENVTEILEVDVDSELLERYSHKAAPLTCDYLMTKNNKPLDVYILAGSIGDFDDILIGCDAVVCIELIEHLTEEVLNKIPYNIFHKIRPKLAIFTTPNADFNSLLPNFKGLRNDDHKFEWTRKEFFNWTQNILKLYPEYSARFYGIGAGPEGTENLGCCSQMVVFQKSDEESFSTARDTSEGVHNYKLIKHYNYPVHHDGRTTEEKIVHEIQYQMSYFSTLSDYYNYDCNESEIPLALLKDYVVDLCPDDEELRNILTKNGIVVREKNNSWYLINADADSCDQTFENDQYSDEESDNDNADSNFVDRTLSDVEACLENFKNIQFGGALEHPETETMDLNKNCDFSKMEKDYIFPKKTDIKSTSYSCNRLARQRGKSVAINRKRSVRSTIDSDIGFDLNFAKSKIPRMKNENKEKYSPERNFGKTNLAQAK